MNHVLNKTKTFHLREKREKVKKKRRKNCEKSLILTIWGKVGQILGSLLLLLLIIIIISLIFYYEIIFLQHGHPCRVQSAENLKNGIGSSPSRIPPKRSQPHFFPPRPTSHNPPPVIILPDRESLHPMDPLSSGSGEKRLHQPPTLKPASGPRGAQVKTGT